MYYSIQGFPLLHSLSSSLGMYHSFTLSDVSFGFLNVSHYSVISVSLMEVARHISGVVSVSAKCYSGISFCESKKTVTIEKDDHKRTYMSSTYNSAIWNHAPVNRSVDDHVQTTN